MGRTAPNRSDPMPPAKTRLKLRGLFEGAGERARWRAREAALVVEEDVVWRSADAVRHLADRAADSPVGRSAGRLRWLIDRRLAWPLTDRLQEQGDLARTAIATAFVVVALGAATGGAMVSSTDEPVPTDVYGIASVSGTASGDTLEGVPPNFVSGQGGSESKPVRSEERPADPVGRTAWDFAQAFVLYEVGRADDAADDFERLATPALAKSLRESPPRLPSEVKVPEARVLNVVIGRPDGKLIAASVSLVRLQAISELRLTLRRDDRGWRVKEIRG